MVAWVGVVAWVCLHIVEFSNTFQTFKVQTKFGHLNHNEAMCRSGAECIEFCARPVFRQRDYGPSSNLITVWGRVIFPRGTTGQKKVYFVFAG